MSRRPPRLVTVLYEDAMAPGAGRFPLHDLVMRMVEDDIDGDTWRLHRLVFGNPRKGVDNVLRDLRRAELIASGGWLFVLVDGDRIARHLGLEATADADGIRRAICNRAGAGPRVEAFLLQPNLEGLIRAIGDQPSGVEPATLERALAKRLNARDIVLRAVTRAEHRELRYQLRRRQPDLDALCRRIGETLLEYLEGGKGA